MASKTSTRSARAQSPTAEPAVQAHARAKYVRVTPRKARRVIDQIRGKSVPEAQSVLAFSPHAAREPVLKVLNSAVANARVKADRHSLPFDERLLVVSAAYVDQGATMKRIQPRAQGRAYQILKRTSHITVHVTQPQDKGGTR